MAKEQEKFELLEPHLDERLRRYVAAAEAQAVGSRGISLVSRATASRVGRFGEGWGK